MELPFLLGLAYCLANSTVAPFPNYLEIPACILE